MTFIPSCPLTRNRNINLTTSRCTTQNIPIAGPSDAISSKSLLQSFWAPWFSLYLGMALMLRWVPCRRRDNVIPSLPTGYLELKLQRGVLPQRGKLTPSSQTSPISKSSTVHRTAFPSLWMGRRDRYKSAVASQAATSTCTHTHIPHTR